MSAVTIVWDFQVEDTDPSGNLILRPVQMSATSFPGRIQDGHKVEVFGKWRQGTLHASKVHNRTTEAWIKGTNSGGFGAIFALTIVTVLCWVIAIVALQTAGAAHEPFLVDLIPLLFALAVTAMLIVSIGKYINDQ
jgi:hypothetical protein